MIFWETCWRRLRWKLESFWNTLTSWNIGGRENPRCTFNRPYNPSAALAQVPPSSKLLPVLYMRLLTSIRKVSHDHCATRSFCSHLRQILMWFAVYLSNNLAQTSRVLQLEIETATSPRESFAQLLRLSPLPVYSISIWRVLLRIMEWNGRLNQDAKKCL